MRREIYHETLFRSLSTQNKTLFTRNSQSTYLSIRMGEFVETANLSFCANFQLRCRFENLVQNGLFRDQRPRHDSAQTSAQDQMLYQYVVLDADPMKPVYLHGSTGEHLKD